MLNSGESFGINPLKSKAFERREVFKPDFLEEDDEDDDERLSAIRASAESGEIVP